MNRAKCRYHRRIIGTKDWQRFLAFAMLLLFLPAEDLRSGEGKKAPAAKGKGETARTLFDGKSLKNWRIIKRNDFEQHGKVFVKNGAVVIEKGKPASGIAFTGKIPRMNYQLVLEAKRTDGSDFFCGLTFPVNNSYCTLIIGGWGGGTTGLSNVDDASADENQTSGYTQFKNGQWYRVRLRVAEKRIEVWIDDERIIDLDSTDRKFSIWWEQEPVRPLGIATWHTSAAVRAIRLTTFGKTEQTLPVKVETKKKD